VEVLVDGAERYLALRDREVSRPQSRAGAKAFKAKIFDAKTFDAKTFDAKTFDARIFDAEAFVAMPEEIRLRLLKRAIDRFGHEGPAELGKVEALLEVVDRAVAESRRGRLPSLGQSSLGQSSPGQSRLKQTLAGALVSLIDGRIRVEPAPPRRSRVG
jgi:tRNA(Ile)-lysidine synthase